jgi:hypothetical protein
MTTLEHDELIESVLANPVTTDSGADVDVDPADEAEAVQTLDVGKYRAYIRLRNIQKAREAEAVAAKEEADAMEEELLAASGMPRIPLDGYLAYLQTRTTASKKPEVSQAAFLGALRSVGAEALIKASVNANTLAAFVREYLKNDEPVPDALAAVLNVTEVPRLLVKQDAGARAATARSTRTTH